MASTDATPLPIRNQALRITFGLWLTTGLINTGASGLDSEVSIDGGTYADCTNEATEIATASGTYYLDITSGEMNGDTIAIQVKSSTTNAITYKITIYPSSTGKMLVAVQTIGGQSVSAAGTITFPASIGTSTLTQAQVTGGAYTIQNVSCVLGDARIVNLDATVSSRLASGSYTAPPSAATISSTVWGEAARTITGGTIGTYTGNVPQTGDAFLRIGATGSGLTSLAPSATALSSAVWTPTIAGFLDTAISSRASAVELAKVPRQGAGAYTYTNSSTAEAAFVAIT